MLAVPMQRPSIKRQRLHDQITRYLAIQILQGKLRDGAPGFSSETELSAYLKVSRTALRESIKVLAAKGLMEVRPKIGIRIRPREEWNLMDPDLLAWRGEAGVVDDLFVRNLCEVRLIVETAACELAAIRGSEEDIAQIKEAYRRAESVAYDSLAYGEADIDFHNTIFSACDNELLAADEHHDREGIAQRAGHYQTPTAFGRFASSPGGRRCGLQARRPRGTERNAGTRRLVCPKSVWSSSPGPAQRLGNSRPQGGRGRSGANREDSKDG